MLDVVKVAAVFPTLDLEAYCTKFTCRH